MKDADKTTKALAHTLFLTAYAHPELKREIEEAYSVSAEAAGLPLPAQIPDPGFQLL